MTPSYQHDRLGGHADSGGLSAQNQRIIAAAKLTSAQHRKKTAQAFIEGSNAVEAALRVPGCVREVFHTSEAAHRYQQLVSTAQHQGITATLISDKAALKLRATTASPGIFALINQPERPTLDCISHSAVMVVGGSDPGNVGTIIRLADAFGSDAVLLTAGSVDHFNPKVVRASAGSVFHIPVIPGVDALTALEYLRVDKKLTVCATTGKGATLLTELPAHQCARAVWVMGNEAHGLPEEIIAQADYDVTIPMRGKAESLNVTAAAAICLYTSLVLS